MCVTFYKKGGRGMPADKGRAGTNSGRTSGSGRAVNSRAAANQGTAGSSSPSRTVKRKKRTRSMLLDLVKIAAFCVFLICSLNVIITSQAKIADQRAQIERLQQIKDEEQKTQDELKRLLGAADEYEYMLEAAINRGYAYPRERRFYPKSNPD